MRRFEDYSTLEDCYVYTARYDDFDKDHDWQKSYFELMSWKNTWGLCYDLDIRSNRESVWVHIVTKAKKNIKEHMLEALDELGYRKVEVDEAKVRVFDPYDIWPEDLDNDDIYNFYIA